MKKGHEEGCLRVRGTHKVVFGLLSAAIPGACVCAQTYLPNYSATTLAGGLSNPTCMAMAPDGSVYIAQQAGVLKRWSSGGGTVSVTSFTVDSTVENGFIGLAVDPGFASNRYLYVYCTVTSPNHNTIRRITLDSAGTALVPGSMVTLLDLDTLTGGPIHNGGGMHFGPDGRLFVGVGENGMAANAQSISNLLGKILRLDTVPGNVIPTDNPTSFPGISGSPTGNNRAIWAVGLRNPFTFAFQPGTGRMFINDVGESSWEEINDGIAGRNYGWPGTEGPFNPSLFPNFTGPTAWYTHPTTAAATNGPPGIGTFTGTVITGGTFYNPATPNFPIAMAGDYFFADAYASFIRTFDVVQNTGAEFVSGVFGVIDLAVAPDGTLLYLSRGSGSLVRVTYTGVSGVCCLASGSCSTSNGIGCAGSFLWGTVSCSPNPCPQPAGACCIGTTCMATTQDECAGTGTHFAGALTVCNAPGNNLTPCCKADIDQNGAVRVTDIFGFLTAWFGRLPAADFNGDAIVGVADIFAFLSAWFAGC